MAIKKYIPIFVFSFIAGLAYGQPGSLTLRISPDAASGGTVSQLFDSVKYIPLETSAKSIFGRIDKLIVTNRYFFILDHSTDAILIFDRNGRFYSKADLAKWVKTPNRQELGINDFTVNESKREIFISHNEKQHNIYVLNFQGKLLRVLKKYVWVSFGCIDNDHYLAESGGDIVDSAGHRQGNCVITGEDFHIQKFLLRHVDHHFNMGVRHNITATWNTDKIFYSRTYDYSAYLIDSNGVATVCHFVFPYQYSLPGDFLQLSAREQRNYLEQHPEVIYSLSDLYKPKQFMLFMLNKWSPGEQHLSLIYSRQSGNLYALKHISPDSSNAFLPVSRDDAHVLAADTNSIYMAVPAYKLKNAYDSNKSKSPSYSPRMQQFFANQKRESNPVIVRLALKDNL